MHSTLKFSSAESEVLWDFVNSCNAVMSQEHIPDLFHSLRHFVPFEYVSCGITALYSQHFEVVANNYPTEFVQFYVKYGFDTEPALYKLRHTLAAVATSEDEEGMGLERHNVDSFKLAYGIRNCLSVAMRGRLGFALYLAVSNFADADKWKLLRGLQLIAPTLLSVCDRLIVPGEKEQEKGHAIAGCLTKRESEVVQGMLAGKTNSEIACAMGISERTVRFHIEEIARKAGSTPRLWSPRVRLVVSDSIALGGLSSIGRSSSVSALT